MAKTHDLCVKVGGHNGKGQYENVGCIIDNGKGPMMLLRRTFNPAGVPNPDGKDSVILSSFPVREKTAQQQEEDTVPF